MLAPHPLYFTLDGRPCYTEVVVNGKIYIVGWNGKKMTIDKVSGTEAVFNRFFGKLPPGPKEPRDMFADPAGCALGCAVVLLVGVMFWAVVFWIFW